MRARRLIGIAVAALFVVLSGMLLYVRHIGSLFGGCEIIRLKEVPSPDGSKSVVIYRKECGATAPYNTQASIASSGVFFSPESMPPFLIIRDIQEVQATWSGEMTVRVRLIPGTGAVYKRDQGVGGIRIEYK